MIEDLDPPSFQFGRGRGDRDPEEPLPRRGDPDYLEEEPLEPEIIVRRTGEGAAEPRTRGFRRLVPEMSETTARVVVAIPWAIFAIAIVGIGGVVFTLAVIVVGILRAPGVFRVGEPEQPLPPPAPPPGAGGGVPAHH